MNLTQTAEREVIVEVPAITMLGALDDSQDTESFGLDAVSSKPIFAIIYNAI